MESGKCAIREIARDLQDLASTPEKANLVVLLLHDVTGVKKKDIKKILEYGPKLDEIYSTDQDFQLNKTPEGKTRAQTGTKFKKAQKRQNRARKGKKK